MIMWTKETEKTENDLRAMPYVYLFQLARSQYGFRQYLLTHTENADSLLRFALWRTDVCRALEKQAAEIADALTYGIVARGKRGTGLQSGEKHDILSPIL